MAGGELPDGERAQFDALVEQLDQVLTPETWEVALTDRLEHEFPGITFLNGIPAGARIDFRPPSNLDPQRNRKEDFRQPHVNLTALGSGEFEFTIRRIEQEGDTEEVVQTRGVLGKEGLQEDFSRMNMKNGRSMRRQSVMAQEVDVMDVLSNVLFSEDHRAVFTMSED